MDSPIGEMWQPGTSKLFRVQDLLRTNFFIPAFQRPYDWRESQVDEFITDLRNASHKRQALFLGLSVVYMNEGRLGIVDGQQRLTTLMLALAAVRQQAAIFQPSNAVNRLWLESRSTDDGTIVERLVSGEPVHPETLSQNLLIGAYRRLSEMLPGKVTAAEIEACELIVYVAPKLEGATALFERINLRGRKVSQFDLVKNKLIEVVALVQGDADRAALIDRISRSYDKLYRIICPKRKPGAKADAPLEELDADRLLRVHWILFDKENFDSSSRVLDVLIARVEMLEPVDLAAYILRYIDSLALVAEHWARVVSPDVSKGNDPVEAALLDFARLNREAEYQPVIVAALLKMPQEANDVIRFCEIASFRDALAMRRANYRRTQKWRIARQLFHGELEDATGAKISTAKELNHRLFWPRATLWDRQEALVLDPIYADAYDDGEFAASALHQTNVYGDLGSFLKYFFWQYGTALGRGGRSKNKFHIDAQLPVFLSGNWHEFRAAWDIEHIYPQKPDDRFLEGATLKAKKAFREYNLSMKPYLHSLGNLTLLPARDNRRLKNVCFQEKLDAMREIVQVNFNELLGRVDYRGKLMSSPYWGPNNCRRRLAELDQFAAERWGMAALKNLGVGAYDKRVDSEWDASEEDGIEGD
ncbi:MULTISPECIES: DUF262 domain-containing protein [Achromobacter]|uniref:DUF262 domain-containing HNH endonuclease family protein n=1 Tax=Achromobacter spanius TaxID=217203 RepID=A0ABY8GZX6_9BURK|nr:MULTISPECIES: DUF262 domain-containing HNH endonuclease family protein [Achromobacter]WAI85762.1 DUF262 domain-containing HNH endonuclease family protein [Achromobacter spanius]WEX95843.1 DUF262 domain-containing HNH endonuclease family protein [Achromobacter sp. SS2-2022]WFP10436.1 DUF262 domain-containing HNH endonuclease family protein [Achromobacter spanius]